MSASLESKRVSRQGGVFAMYFLAASLFSGCGGDEVGDGGSGEHERASAAVVSDKVGDADARLSQALMLYGRRDHVGGRSLGEQVLAAHPGSYRARFVIALGYHKAKRYGLARQLFAEILESKAEFAGSEAVDHFLAWAQYHLGELDAARQSFSRHLESAPEFADSLFGLGLVALEQDRLDEAHASFEKALASQKADPRKRARAARTAMRLGDVHARRGEWEFARARFEEAIQGAPTLESARYKLSRAIKRLATDEPPATTIADEASSSRLRFTELDAKRTGLDVVMVSGRMPSTQIVEVKGGGLALIDFDGDGDLDVFVPNGATLDSPNAGPGCRLYENLGGLRFQDVTEQAGLTFRAWGYGVAVADVDGDGRQDLYISCYGPNVLLRNAGGGRFEDVSASAGVADPGWGTGCAFGDLDGDGDLDLYVCNNLVFDPAKPPRPASFKNVDVLGGPIGLPAQHDVVYENLGEGRFRDVSEAWGFRRVKPAYALNVAIVDFDSDGRQDVFVANDSMTSYLFTRTDSSSPRFEEIGLESGVGLSGDGLAQASMGIALADVDGNGFVDVFTTNFSGDSNTLHMNLGGQVFDDRTSALGLGRVSMTFLGWACGFFDFDLDGDEDLLVFNGHVFPQATLESFDSPYEQPPLLFERRAGRFWRVEAKAAGAWLDVGRRDRSAAFGDLDGDGDVDVLVGGLHQTPRVLRNDVADEVSWLVVAIDDQRASGKNRCGIGSRVDVIAADRRWRRWISGGGPFQSASAQEAYFGLGRYTGPVTIEVAGPAGDTVRQVVEGVNRRVVVSLLKN